MPVRCLSTLTLSLKMLLLYSSLVFFSELISPREGMAYSDRCPSGFFWLDGPASASPVATSSNPPSRSSSEKISTALSPPSSSSSSSPSDTSSALPPLARAAAMRSSSSSKSSSFPGVSFTPRLLPLRTAPLLFLEVDARAGGFAFRLIPGMAAA